MTKRKQNTVSKDIIVRTASVTGEGEGGALLEIEIGGMLKKSKDDKRSQLLNWL